MEFIVLAVEGHDRFQKLAQRYAALTEQMTSDRRVPRLKRNSGASGGLLPANGPLPESLVTQGIGDFAALERDLLAALKHDGAHRLEQLLERPDIARPAPATPAR